jgi:hypothetical protein
VRIPSDPDPYQNVVGSATLVSVFSFFFICSVLLTLGPKTIAEELVNLPADPVLSTSSVKSKSYSSLLLGQ